MLKPILSAIAMTMLLAGCGQGGQDEQPQGNSELEQALAELQQESEQLSSEVIKRTEQVLRDTEATMEEKTAALRDLDMNIRELVGVPYADNLSQCRLLAVGSRPCGGPQYYMAYSTKNTDPDVIQPLVNSYSELQSWFHQEHQMMGTCEVIPEPNLTVSNGICVAQPTETM